MKEEPKVEQTFMLKIMHEQKRDKMLFFIMWLITFIALLGAGIYIIYLQNDIGTITTTQEISDVDTISGNVVNNGDSYGESKTSN